MIHRLKKTISMTVSSSQKWLKCDMTSFTLWNWEENGCHLRCEQGTDA